MDFPENSLRFNPVKKANPISRHFFFWIIPFFYKGYKKDLELDDLFTPRNNDVSATLGDTLEKAWNTQLQLYREGKVKKPMMVKALWSVFGRYYTGLTILYLITDCILRVGQPLVLRYLVRSFAPDAQVPERDQYLLGGGVVLITFLVAMVFHPSFHFGFVTAMRCRVSCSSLIYRKSLRLSKSSHKTATAGQLVNLLSNDVSRFDGNVLFFPYLLAAPIQLATLTYLLWTEFGVYCLSGIGIVLVVTVLQYWNGRFSTQFRRQIAMKTDERGRTMTEIISSIRVIKMYAWEKPFTALIHKLRKLEMSVIRKRSFLRGIYLSTFSSASKVIPFVTFLFFVLGDNQITADKVFFTAAAYNVIIQTMMYFIPTAVSGLGEVGIALNRIEEFLLLEEKENEESKEKPVNANEVTLRLEEATASWTGTLNHLETLNLNFKSASTVCVVGSIGSGKSTLLHVLLRELKLKEGNYFCNGRISYACQEPWIFAGNVRQNILFGKPYHEGRYKAAISASALIDDLHQFEHGEMTVIGDRGVSLSGGQRARINLARCLYQEADIYLLDDPLSAVDSKVSRHIFEKCVRGYLREKLVILVTHQLQYLPQADHIVVLDDGRILAQGTFSDLTQAGVDFVRLLTTDEEEDEEDIGNNNNAVLSQKRKSRKESENKPSTLEVDLGDHHKQEGHAEKMAQGSVGGTVYWKYFKTGGSFVGFFVLVVACIATQLSITTTEVWLSIWSSTEERRRTGNLDENDYLGEPIYLGVYGGLVALVLFLNLSRAIGWFMYSYLISVNMHNKMFQSVVRAPTKFFDDNPPGRVMNRFTKDLGQMDELLPPIFFESTVIFLQMIGVLGVVIYTNWVVAIPAVVVLIIMFGMYNFFVATSRDVKRIEGITKSPVFTHAVATLNGLSTIRSNQAESILVTQFDGLQDYHTASWFMFICSQRWFGIWVELVSISFLAAVTFSFLLFDDSSDGSNVGLAISSAMNLTGWFQFAMRQSSEVANYMTSVERTLEYVNLPAEAKLESAPEKKPPSSWPSSGEILFKDVSLTYSEKPVLRNLNFSIRSSEKIAIVGRTGAGKSTIIQALFRMTEPSGQIFIDGVEINDIGLHDLRQSISIIPQEPVLFCGSMRYNLDPFQQFEDNELWRVLEEVGLKSAVPQLDFEVSDGGSNFSSGQKQLICLARAVLRKNKILIMDEATANVDPITDQFIQDTIRQKFATCTIITIAHRLHTIMDSDRVLVLDKGSIKEYDHPWNLLQNHEGIFYSMVHTTGKASADLLTSLAENSYKKLKAE